MTRVLLRQEPVVVVVVVVSAVVVVVPLLEARAVSGKCFESVRAR